MADPALSLLAKIQKLRQEIGRLTRRAEQAEAVVAQQRRSIADLRRVIAAHEEAELRRGLAVIFGGRVAVDPEPAKSEA